MQVVCIMEMKYLLIALSIILVIKGIYVSTRTLQEVNYTNSEKSLIKHNITNNEHTILLNNIIVPRLILHIGPHKTGTSSLQCDLSHYQNELYRNASVAYLGRVYSNCVNRRNHRLIEGIDTRSLINGCLSSTNCTEKEVWKSLEDQVAYFSKRNTSIIISDEAFSRIPANNVNGREMLYRLFDRYYPGRVYVVIYYRRYYEWMVSMWNEGKPYQNTARHLYKEKFKKWPPEGGRTTQTFLSFMSNRNRLMTSTTMKNYDPNAKTPYHDLADAQNIHLTRYLQKLWSNHSSIQLVLNSHEMKGGDSTVNFLRSVFPTSHAVADTLVKAKMSNAFTGRSNPSKSFEYDLLAVAAHKHGLLVNIEIGRPTVAALTEKHLLQFLNKTVDELPFQCLNDTQLRVFLNRSLEYEKQMYPYQAEDITFQHKAAFIEASKKKKFCNIDHDKLLTDKAVQDFFSELQQLTSDLINLWGKKQHN